jgi:hypothetical protein
VVWAVGAPVGIWATASLFVVCTGLTVAGASFTHRHIEMRFKRGPLAAFRAPAAGMTVQ